MKEQYQPPFAEHTIRQIYPNYNHKELIKFLDNKELDRCLGCMFGSFSGDAIGAYLQFNVNFTPQQLKQAMEMSPGGTFNLRGGQVTDDSEMSLHLLQALNHYDSRKSMKQQRLELTIQIALQYVKWKKSKPFDIGNTTRGSLKVLEAMQQVRQLKEHERLAAFDDVLFRVAQTNHASQSNGSLMRITPMVFFITLMNLYPKIYDRKSEHEQMFLLAEDEVRLVHPNPKLVSCSMHWVKTLLQIANRKSNQQIRKIYQNSITKAKQVLGDWADQVEQVEPMPATQNIGWAKIAWSYGMRELKEISQILRKNPEYKLDEFYFIRVMETVLKRGGDTDTNLAIVGGLLGALVGFKNIPSKYIRKLIEVNFSKKQLKRGHDRPQFYEPRTALKLAFKCFQQLRQSTKQHIHKPKV